MADDRQFGPVIWRRGAKKEPLLASAFRVDLSSRKTVQKVLSYRQDWQQQAINDLHAIGELQYGVSTPASLVARIVFFAAKPAPQSDAQPIRVKDEESGTGKLAIETMERLGNVLSRADFQFDLAINFLVAGEAYIVCFGERPEKLDGVGNLVAPATPEHWVIRSVREVKEARSSIETWDDMRNEDIILDQEQGDTFIRVWRPDPFNHKLATSHIRSILGPAEELLHWDAAAEAAAKNRLTLAGLLGIPDNLTVKPMEDEDSRFTGTSLFINRLSEAAKAAIQNPRSGAAAVPIFFEYPDNEQKKSGIEKIEFNRPQDDLLEKRTDRSLQRIEQGINLPAGVISGLGQATHWGGGQIEESVFRDHVEPLVLFICSALTRSFLQPILREAGKSDADEYLVWYDASSLIVHRDKAANAQRALEAGAITWGTLRRELGFSENDAPTDEEAKKIFDWLSGLRRGTTGAPAETIRISEQDPNAPPAQNAPGGRTPTEQKIGPLKGKGQSPLPGKVAASITDPDEAMLIAQLQVLCDEKVRRALERAGNKLRSRAAKDPNYKYVIDRVHPMEVAATLGRETVTKLGASDLFDDAFTDIHTRVLSFIPTDALALDTTQPIQNLVKELRSICSEFLYGPPSAQPIVPLSLIEQMIESLANPGTAA